MARAPTSIEHLDFENLSDGQLRDLIQHARQTLGERIQTRLDEFRALAQEAGFTVSISRAGEGGEPRQRRRRSPREGGADGDDRRGQVAAKYRNPDKASETWSGRGRQPKWVSDKLAAGKTLDDLLISPEPPARPSPTGQEAAS